MRRFMITSSHSIGYLSNLSSHSEQDQQIPEITATSSRRITQRMERTVIEHVESGNESGHVCDTSYTGEQGSRYRNQSTPPRPNSSKDLYRLVERVYRTGSRSPQLIRLLHSVRSPIPLRVAVASADYIERVWTLLDASQSQTQQSLTNYIANIIYRLGPSVITVFTAIFYVGRLKRFYPKAIGEHGCGHRLFTVSLLIAYRYLECQAVIDEEFYHTWSLFSNGVFQAADLFRMELEFVAFLKFNLYISYEDFEYFVDRVYNSDGGQIVPRCLDIPQISQPLGGTPQDGDAFVPTLSSSSPH